MEGKEGIGCLLRGDEQQAASSLFPVEAGNEIQFAQLVVSVTVSSASKIPFSTLFPPPPQLLVVLEIIQNSDLPASSYSLRFHLLTNDDIM